MKDWQTTQGKVLKEISALVGLCVYANRVTCHAKTRIKFALDIDKIRDFRHAIGAFINAVRTSNNNN